MNFKEHQRRLRLIKNRGNKNATGIRNYWNMLRLCWRFVRALFNGKMVIIQDDKFASNSPAKARKYESALPAEKLN